MFLKKMLQHIAGPTGKQQHFDSPVSFKTTAQQQQHQSQSSPFVSFIWAAAIDAKRSRLLALLPARI